ncbi:MAG: hypothetical protein ACR2IL_08020 [Chitinophagaceae bacterium]
MFKFYLKHILSLMFLPIAFSSCDNMFLGPSILSKTIEYKDENFENACPFYLSFGSDSIYSEIWHRTLNVDGGNKRIFRFIFNGDTTIFPLQNAVNNYTAISCYSLKVDKQRYIWIEDNFATTVIDIDARKAIKVRNSKKILDDIAPTGAPIGVKNNISINDIKYQLKLTKNIDVVILDSLSFDF